MGEDITSFWTDIKQYEGLLERDPDSYAFIPLSELYRKMGLFDDALAVAQRGCSRHPSLVGGQLALGLACHAVGLKDECREALEKVVRIMPENVEAQRILSRLYADAGEHAAAGAALGIILSLSPDDLESRVILESLSRSNESTGEGVLPSAAISGEQYGIDGAGAMSDFMRFPADVEAESPMPVVEENEFSTAVGAELDEEEIIDLDDDSIVEELDEVTEALPATGDNETVVPEPPPLASVTMAELYVKQGFNDLAIGVYRQLVAANPMDTGLLVRLDELLSAERAAAHQGGPATPSPSVVEDFDQTAPMAPSEEYDFEQSAPVAVAETPAEMDRQEPLVPVLEGWLESIRRVKACRSSLH